MTVTYVRASRSPPTLGLAYGYAVGVHELDAELWRDAEDAAAEADADGRDGVLLPRALRRLLEKAAAGFAPAEEAVEQVSLI